MKIIFKKQTGKHIITYKRDGLIDHWFEADDFLILHDLSHYAIEKTLRYQKAFWGLIKAGVNPSDFEDKQTREKIFVSNEAWYTETMANLILMELTQGPFEDFNTVFLDTLKATNPTLPELELSAEQLHEIRTYYLKLVHKWKSLNAGEKLILEF